MLATSLAIVLQSRITRVGLREEYKVGCNMHAGGVGSISTYALYYIVGGLRSAEESNNKKAKCLGNLANINIH